LKSESTKESRLPIARKARIYFKKAIEGLKELGDVMYYNVQHPEQIYYQGFAYEKFGDYANAKDVLTGCSRTTRLIVMMK